MIRIVVFLLIGFAPLGSPASCQTTGSPWHAVFTRTREQTRDVQSPQAQEAPEPSGLVSCNPTVVAQPAPVVTAQARIVAANSVLPAGVVGPTGFDWPDTPIGVVKSLDGTHYLSFGSDGSCHENCNLATERDGSITRTEGTLNNPLGASSPEEFVLPTDTLNLPAYMLYAGGGPVYRVPRGAPGAGDLLLVYQAARASFESGYQYPDCDSDHKNCYQHQNGFYSYLGLARSTDDGRSWKDLGLIISPATPYSPQLTWDIGLGNLVVVPGKYFYIYFPDLIENASVDTGLSVARVSYTELLTAVAKGSPIPHFTKYSNGEWSEPGLGGVSSSVLPNGPYWGDNNVAWNSATHQFTAILDDSVHISMTESHDGVHWSPSVLLFEYDADNCCAEYAAPVGTGIDPSILNSSFYVYFTHYPSNGTGWDDASLQRFKVQCDLSEE